MPQSDSSGSPSRQPSTRSRKLKARLQEHHPAEEVDLDSGLNLPHIPIMAHLKHEDPSHRNREDPSRCADPMGLKEDRPSVILLIFLYVLQGIPLGLAGAVPYLLQSRNVSYKDQAMFSFVYWPFSVKLLWAPIVDSVYFSKFGRRKSWLVPVQYLIGIFMLLLSTTVTDLIEGENMNIFTLTVVFFMLNFLAATQDIAVDGWALTMLSRRNVGWASTCNSVGQTAGFFLGYVVFLAFESANFCNKYIRSEPKPYGMLTLADFMFFWGIVFIITTTLVMFVKNETDKSVEENTTNDSSGVETEGIVETYLLLWKIVRLPAVTKLILILLTAKIGFAASDAVTGLKLIGEGVPRDSLALLAIPMVPIQIILPLVISKYTSGPKPLDIFLKAMPYRLAMGLVFAAVVYWTPSTKLADGEYPSYLYMVILFVYGIQQVFLNAMFVAQMAFNAMISDPTIGGTYMTLLNTVNNLGGNWPSTVALWLVDFLTWKTCTGTGRPCNSPTELEECTKAGGKCEITIDGYYIEILVCFVIGVAWIIWKRNSIRKLQDLPAKAWACSPSS